MNEWLTFALVVACLANIEFGIIVALYLLARCWPDCEPRYRWLMFRDLSIIAVGGVAYLIAVLVVRRAAR